MRKLDLRTGRTVWQAYRAPPVPVVPLTRDIKTEVLIVGMGISGAMIAEMLTASGHEVVMIDRRGPLLGSTAATTALVQFEIDTPLTELAKKIGREKADAPGAGRGSRLPIWRSTSMRWAYDAMRRSAILSISPAMLLARLNSRKRRSRAGPPAWARTI